MRSRLTVFSIPIAFLLVALMSAPALFGQGPPRQRQAPMSVDDELATLTKDLNLTDEQVTKMKPILEESRSQMMKARERFRSQDRTEASRDQRRATMEKMTQDTDKKLAEVLSADQLKQYQDLRTQRMHQMRGMRGRPGQNPGGPPQ